MIWLALLVLPATPEARALGYLGREVPAWSAENHCYSCHNNGDAARALDAASSVDVFRAFVPEKSLDDTTAWLAKPEGWDHNGGEGPFSDKRLATIQFALALAAFTESGRIRDRAPLLRAAGRLAGNQAEDGSFPIDGPEAIGSPATYGRPLATALAARALETAGGHGEAVAKARRWLADRPIRNTLDAAAIRLGGADDGRALAWLLESQGDDGGWGPYATSPAEVFDTAIALRALGTSADRGRVAPAIRRARGYLVAQQLADGSWVETTRPPGGDSYAQRLSTSGWATLALIDAHLLRADLLQDPAPRP